jgi:hypothetical protein
VNKLHHDDGSRKYVTLGEYQEKRKKAKKKVAAKIKK